MFHKKTKTKILRPANLVVFRLELINNISIKTFADRMTNFNLQHSMLRVLANVPYNICECKQMHTHQTLYL